MKALLIGGPDSGTVVNVGDDLGPMLAYPRLVEAGYGDNDWDVILSSRFTTDWYELRRFSLFRKEFRAYVYAGLSNDEMNEECSRLLLAPLTFDVIAGQAQ